ncbi:MAG TPA: MarR family winged helix-turn-helix transcriptional regulator [Vicinamibacteria bacterium]|nr:MarR family winged helix-turn-helix transcriptional regulator [Vicinamibacteria bacterium]
MSGAAESDATRLRTGIRALVRRFSVSERADVACCGMTVAQAATIETLASTGPQRLGDLGRRLGIAPSTLTRNIGRLLETGLLEREADPDDARSSRVTLTSAGRRAAARLEEQEAGFGREVLERLPPERREAVVEALQELLVAVREATESCCPGAFDHLMAEFPQGEMRCTDERCE